MLQYYDLISSINRQIQTTTTIKDNEEEDRIHIILMTRVEGFCALGSIGVNRKCPNYLDLKRNRGEHII